MKTALLDASSAIILYKAGLHNLLIKIYAIIMSGSVYREISINPYAGSEAYSKFVSLQKIQVQEILDQKNASEMRGLDRGEYDTIALFRAGSGDFVITDDGQAARFCKREGIPFINALLFPVIIKFARIKDEKFCQRSMEKVIETGRYSDEVINFARDCDEEILSFAIP